MTPLTIRPAQHDDLEALCRLFEELDEHHRRARPGLFRPATGAAREPSFVAGFIDGPASTMLVAQEAEGALLGFATAVERTIPASVVRDERRFTEIDNLVVAAPARRRGIARALVDAAEAWSAARGIPSLELNVYAFNDAAAFYEAAGFETVLMRMRREVRPTAATSGAPPR